ncbi:MAG: hypothetical protein RIR39_555 [Pseudomonadota bacterium]|jgi:hypothetical protein
MMNRNQIWAIAVLLLGACSVGGPDLTGSWKGQDVTFEVSKEGELYKVVVNNPGGMVNGTFTGKYQDGAIKVGAPMCGDITYSKEADKLYFCGAELGRVKK